MKNLVLFVSIALLFISCIGTTELPVSKYYEYDNKAPLYDSLLFEEQHEGYVVKKYSYISRSGKKVKALLSIPTSDKPMPVVIFMHGFGDKKTVDYIQAGHKYFIDNGYAVFRIDIFNHGERFEEEIDFSFTNDNKYRSREVIIQTVFDLRRGMDFLETRKEVDANRVGYYGISLGGIIGTIFSGVDERVKASVIAIAGGGLNLMFGTDALSDKALDFFSIMDPVNYVELISPRPLLMINARNDEVVPPFTSKLLFKKAGNPKEIIWYDAKHKTLPQDKVFLDGVNWYKKYL